MDEDEGSVTKLTALMTIAQQLTQTNGTLMAIAREITALRAETSDEDLEEQLEDLEERINGYREQETEWLTDVLESHSVDM